MKPKNKNKKTKTQTTISFLKETKNGKYAPIEKIPTQLIRFEDESAEIETDELYYHVLD